MNLHNRVQSGIQVVILGLKAVEDFHRVGTARDREYGLKEGESGDFTHEVAHVELFGWARKTGELRTLAESNVITFSVVALTAFG